MPGIAVVFDRSPEPGERRLDLERMLARLDLPGLGFARAARHGRAGSAGLVIRPGEGGLAEVPGVGWLALDGELLDGGALARELAQAGSLAEREDEDDAQLLARGLARFGERAAIDRAGSFNLFLFDERAGSLRIIGDPMGSRLLYVASDGPRTVIASEAKAVIAGRRGPTSPGGLGLLQLLAGSQHYGDLTWLEGVRTLPARASWRIDRDGVHEGAWGRLRARAERRVRSEDDAAHELRAHLEAAVARSLRGHPERPAALLLSGGLDSRALALAAGPARRSLPTITYGEAWSPDARYAAELAAELGLEHHYVEAAAPRLIVAAGQVLAALGTRHPGDEPPGFYSAQLDRAVWRSEGMVSLLGGFANTLFHPAMAPLASVLLHGASGDVLTGAGLSPALLTPRARGHSLERLRRLLYFQPAEALAEVVAPQLLARGLDELDAHLEALLGELGADSAAEAETLFDLVHGDRRGAFACFTSERPFAAYRAPFLDPELMRFLLALPRRWRFQQRLYKRMMVVAFTEARQVPWAYPRGVITASPGFELAREALNFGRDRARRLLIGDTVTLSRWAFRDVVGTLRRDRAIGRMLLAFARSRHFPGHLLQPAGVTAFVDRFYSGAGGEREAYLLSHLAALACWHEWLARAGDALPPECDPSRFGLGRAA